MLYKLAITAIKDVAKIQIISEKQHFLKYIVNI